MKQILSLALALLPCLALAQYPSNGNQKITLGEQTTADGLIWRGVASDTTLTAKSDTAAYFVLDTVNINLYTYKASATGRKWRQLETDSASIAYVNTYGTQTVNGAKTFTSTVTGARFDPTSSSASGTGMYLAGTNKLGFSTNGVERFVQTNSSLSINNSTPLGYPFELFGTSVNTRLYIAGTTNPVVAQFANNGGTWYFGMDDSNGSNYTGIAYARFIYSSSDVPFIFFTNGTERLKIHGSGGLKFKPQSAPTAEEGTVYYDSATKKLKVYNGTSWIDLH